MNITRLCTHRSPEINLPDWLREARFAAQQHEVSSARSKEPFVPDQGGLENVRCW